MHALVNPYQCFVGLLSAREQLSVPPRCGARNSYSTTMPSKVLARAATTFSLMATLVDGQASSAAGALDAGGEECRIVPKLTSHVQLNNGVSSESRTYTTLVLVFGARHRISLPSPFFLSPLYGLVEYFSQARFT